MMPESSVCTGGEQSSRVSVPTQITVGLQGRCRVIRERSISDAACLNYGNVI